MDLIFRQSHWALAKKPLQSRATNPGKTVIFFLFNCFSLFYFFQIKSPNDFYDWARQVLAPGLRAGTWYNQDIPLGLAGYINDKNSRMIGYATLRQLRVKNS